MSLRRPLLFITCVTAIIQTTLGAGITVVDDLGRTVILAGPGRRIVSLAPSVTETVYAIGAGPSLIGVTDYCNFPDDSRTKTRIGGMTNPSIEMILGLAPDLIIVSMEGNLREHFEKLAGLGVPVFVTNPRTLTGIYRTMEQLGTLTGHTDDSRRLVDSLVRREGLLRSRIRNIERRVLFFVSVQPLLVAGGSTFLGELLTLAGARNLAASLPGSYPAYSREAVLAADPDVLFVTSDIVTGLDELLALYPEWNALTAMRAHRIYSINADIVSRPGPRALDGLETLVNILHSIPP